MICYCEIIREKAFPFYSSPTSEASYKNKEPLDNNIMCKGAFGVQEYRVLKTTPLENCVNLRVKRMLETTIIPHSSKLAYNKNI